MQNTDEPDARAWRRNFFRRPCVRLPEAILGVPKVLQEDLGAFDCILESCRREKRRQVIQSRFDVSCRGPNRDGGLHFEDRVSRSRKRARKGEGTRQLGITPNDAGKHRSRLRSGSAQGHDILGRNGVSRPRVSDDIRRYRTRHVGLCVDSQ